VLPFLTPCTVSCELRTCVPSWQIQLGPDYRPIHETLSQEWDVERPFYQIAYLILYFYLSFSAFSTWIRDFIIAYLILSFISCFKNCSIVCQCLEIAHDSNHMNSAYKMVVVTVSLSPYVFHDADASSAVCILLLK
jgi:hypothetical protein